MNRIAKILAPRRTKRATHARLMAEAPRNTAARFGISPALDTSVWHDPRVNGDRPRD
jgi:hypothetical protein